MPPFLPDRKQRNVTVDFDTPASGRGRDAHRPRLVTLPDALLDSHRLISRDLV